MKWTKASIPPPKEWGQYLTIGEGGYYYGVLTYKHGGWWNDRDYVDGVTHWMPLPPKPGDESPSSDPAEVLVKALEWYADKDNYTADNGEFATAWRDQMDYKAVKALKTYQDEMGKGK